MEATEAIALEIQRLAARMRLEVQERGEASSLSVALMAAAAQQMVLECEELQRRRRGGGGEGVVGVRDGLRAVGEGGRGQAPGTA